MSVSELEHLVFDKMNNISCLPKYFIRCAAYDAKAQYDSYEFIYDYKENNREEPPQYLTHSSPQHREEQICRNLFHFLAF